MNQKGGNSLTGIEQKVYQYVKDRQLLMEGDRVLAGVSGGADSVCLLLMLLALQRCILRQNVSKELKVDFDSSATGHWLHIEVVHVHHMIRREEADEDAAYVERLCRQHQIPFHLVKKPVEHIAKENRWSVEEAGRRVRYEAFEIICRERKLNKIAVAHHRDDHAETILMNLFRGSGLRGVSGIPAVRGKIVRPLLGLSRDEIEEYLKAIHVEYRTDSTNLDCDYTRNKVRNQLIPYIEEHINAKATEHLVQFGDHAGEIDDYFQKKANILFEKYGRREENRAILCLDCLKEDKIEVTYLIRRMLLLVAAELKDIGNEHVEQIYRLMNGRTGGKCQLPGHMIVEKSYHQCIFSRKVENVDEIRNKQESKDWNGERFSSGDTGEHPECVEINWIDLQEEIPYSIELPEAKFTFTVKKMKKNETFPKKKYTKWFDCDKIKFTLQLRTRKSGDYIVINSQGGRKKLKDYFIDNKIVREERDRRLLLTEGSEILWITGMRISQRYKVEECTTRILEVCME